jgi:lipoprotein-anchoring transpeptidase ErfK/SrfK
LPILDAFFAGDESFAAELKTRLQLTDEQVERLRATAREETSKLRETDSDQQYGGTTAAARQLADEKIKAIIGEEKSEQLAALVRERWSGGGDADSASASNQENGARTAAAKPNAVPADTRIVVNAPAYRMDIFQDGQLVKSYRIGIGYPEFPLPAGLRKASQIIFNPTWTPPDSPWVEASHQGVKPGEKVAAGSKLNPLGLLKIPIGLPSLIHGGKAASKIGGFASHGCVGLTDSQARDFAKRLAQTSGTELTDEQIKSYEQNRSETRTVSLKQTVPVELRYETLVVEDGKLHIYRDVYDRDTNTLEHLKALLSAYGVTFEQLSEAEREQITDALQEMSRDASGRLDQPGRSAKNENKRADEQSARVTRTVKGKKEIVIEIAALAGKGYPAPVNLETGGAPPKSAPGSSGKRSGRGR